MGIGAAAKAVTDAHQTMVQEVEKKMEEERSGKKVEWTDLEKSYKKSLDPSYIDQSDSYRTEPKKITIARVESPELGNPPEPDPPKFRKGYSVRTWKDKTGKYSTVGEMKSFSNWDVIIIKSDGTEAKVPRDKLSDEDLEYLKSGWKLDEKMIKEK